MTGERRGCECGDCLSRCLTAAHAEGLAEAEALKARVAALEKLLAKATVRIEILLGRMHGCDDETTHGVRHVDGHALSYIEGEGWIEEQRAALAEAARSALKSAVIAADPE